VYKIYMISSEYARCVRIKAVDALIYYKVGANDLKMN